MKKKPKSENETGYIYRRYIMKNGKRVYPKNAKVFKIPIDTLNEK